VEELSCPDEVLNLVFAEVTPVFLSDIRLVEKEQAGGEVNVESPSQLLVYQVSVYQAELELSFGLQKGSLQP
jgi:hypothetical protein